MPSSSGGGSTTTSSGSSANLGLILGLSTLLYIYSVILVVLISSRPNVPTTMKKTPTKDPMSTKKDTYGRPDAIKEDKYESEERVGERI